ncbi:MAG: hypothetical protein GY798_02665 [Hyphomicrobiales bacterium]|nr:hypothetical protein [Hyphomicrobiales bacterium]
MVEVMNQLVDEVLKSIQARLANVETDVADIRAELAAVQSELATARVGRPEMVSPPVGIERRVARLERRLDSVDAAIK